MASTFGIPDSQGFLDSVTAACGFDASVPIDAVTSSSRAGRSYACFASTGCPPRDCELTAYDTTNLNAIHARLQEGYRFLLARSCDVLCRAAAQQSVNVAAALGGRDGNRYRPTAARQRLPRALRAIGQRRNEEDRVYRLKHKSDARRLFA